MWPVYDYQDVHTVWPWYAVLNTMHVVERAPSQQHKVSYFWLQQPVVTDCMDFKSVYGGVVFDALLTANVNRDLIISNIYNGLLSLT